MLINTQFTNAVPGQAGDSTVYNANLAKIESYLNEILAYLEQYQTDISGTGQGVVSGCGISEGTGLALSAAAGVAWVGGQRVSVLASTINLSDDSTQYIYLNQDGDYVVESAFTLYTTKIPRAKVVTSSGAITSLIEYDNKIFTMEEMISHRIMPYGISISDDGSNTIVNISYIDPEETGLQTIQIEGSSDDGATWEVIAEITL